MEKVSKKQKELVKKMKTTTLAAKLVRVGMSEEQIEGMDREALMEAWTHNVAEGREESTVVTVSPVAARYDVGLEMERLAFELRKFEAEEKRRKEERRGKWKKRSGRRKDKARRDSLSWIGNGWKLNA
jgi:TPP-dependent pyruvate/acetoin dehydrogenase alpha subunit